MPVIDRKTFDELKQISGDEFINELIDIFLEDAPKMIAELKSALGAEDAETFRRAAHSLKSNAATFGAGQLATLAKKLEDFGKENRLHESRDTLTELEEAYRFAHDELKGLKS